MRREFQIFDDYIRKKGLRHTEQRDRILAVFLATERHVSVDELYRIIKKRYPEIGYTTVYRTMRLVAEAGLCVETDFGDGVARFEHKYGHEHHDHLICIKCGRFIEVYDRRIEKLQEVLVRKHGFKSEHHKLEIFGICKKCNP
jgi:Fur family ferric uptake transcriptional regulator